MTIGEWLCDERVCVVEVVPEGAFSKTPRVVDIKPGDVLEVDGRKARLFGAEAIYPLAVARFEDWGEDKGGWHVKLVHPGHNERQHIVRVQSMLDGWLGVWV